MKILSRNSSGRVAKLRLVGLTPDEVSGQDLRSVAGRTLGWQHIKSTAFELERDGSRFHFEGHGYGHGVGMCVIGSVNLAAGGQSAAQILGRYFPGLAITTLGAPVVAASRPAPAPIVTVPERDEAVTLALSDEDEEERDALTRVVLRARDEIAKDLGVAAPRVAVRFHPTVRSYERATGQPWFTTGAIVGAELHLLPLPALRERGVLDRALRHELVHLMADAALRDRPLWVREGAAGYFAGQRPVAGDDGSARPAFAPQLRPSCPTDVELASPVSAGALSNARAQAVACFAKQAGDGRPWREIK